MKMNSNMNAKSGQPKKNVETRTIARSRSAPKRSDQSGQAAYTYTTQSTTMSTQRAYYRTVSVTKKRVISA